MLGACTSSEQKAAQYAAEAQAYYEAGNYPLAQQAIDNAISERDNVADFFVLKGAITIAAGDRNAAMRAFRNALDLDAANVGALTQYAVLNSQFGRIDEAVKAADKLLVLDPRSIAGLQTKGVVALARRRYAEAIEHADAILALSPNDEGAIAIKARALAATGKLEDAKGLLEKGVTSNGETPLLLVNKLNLYRKMGNAEALSTVFPEVVNSQPENMALKLDYANFLYKTGKADQARSLIVDVLGRRRLPVEEQADAIRLWSEYDPAPLDPTTAATLGKGGSQTIGMVADYLLATGNARIASVMVQNVPPARAGRLAGLKARILHALGEKASARDLMNQALDADSDDVDALLLRGTLALDRKDSRSAIIDLQTVLREEPGNYTAFDLLARAYELEEQNWRARQIYERAVRDLPQNHFIFDRYLAFLHRIGDRSRAMSAARQFVKDSPASLRAWNRFLRECAGSDASSCVSTGQEGRQRAGTLYALDDPPGARPSDGLFGKL